MLTTAKIALIYLFLFNKHFWIWLYKYCTTLQGKFLSTNRILSLRYWYILIWITASKDWNRDLFLRFTLPPLHNIASLEICTIQFSSSVPATLTSTINGVRNAIEAKVEDMEDIYELAITSYALALVKSSKLKTVLDKLDSKATESGENTEMYRYKIC